MLVALSKGGLTTIPTIIPTRINRLRIASGCQHLDRVNQFKAFSEAHLNGKRKSTSNTVFFDESLSCVVAELEMECTAVSDAPMQTNMQLGYSVRVLPDVCLMSDTQLQTFCQLESPIESPNELSSNDPLRQYIELLVHKKPKMKILDIGSGPDFEALSFLAALNKHDDRGGVARMASYEITRPSLNDLEEVKERLSQHDPLLEFKTLDLEVDLSTQGFELGTYDIVLVGQVSYCYNEIHHYKQY